MNQLQTKSEIADAILADLFARRKRIAIAEAVEAGGRADVSRRTLRRAADRLDVREVHNGPLGGFWEIP